LITHIRHIAVIALFFLLTLVVTLAEGDHIIAQRVLIINSYHPGFSWSDNEQAGLISRFQEEYPAFDPSIEYLDSKRYPGKDHLARTKDYLKDKYQGGKFDVIVTLDDDAFGLLVDYAEELFPDTPVVFAGIASFSSDVLKKRGKITGVLERQDIRRTIEVALALHPKTREILAVNDNTVSGMAAHRNTEEALPLFSDRVKVRFLQPGSFDEACATVSSLPPDSLILLNSYTTDSSGKALSTRESTRLIVSASKVPVYGVHENRFGDGIVGGYLLSGQEHGRKAAEMAISILKGESPASIPVDSGGTSKPMFDYRQLERFGIDIKRLPEGSVIINRPLTIFDTNPQFAYSIIFIVAILLAMISILAVLVFRIRRAREALSVKTYELDRIFRLSPDLLCLADMDGRFIRLNPSWENTLGYRIDELEGTKFIELVHPDDLDATLEAVAELSKGENITDFTNRYHCKDGSYRWIEWRSIPYKKTLIYAAARDITERRRTEQALQEAETRYRMLFDHAPNGIVIMDPETMAILDLNETLCRQFGYSREELMTLDLADIEIDGKPEENRTRIEKARQDGRNDFETRIRKKNGDIRTIDVTMQLTEIAGRPVCHAVISDITEHRRLMEQLNHSRKLEGLGQLAGGIAHDFNNVLNVVIGFTELMKMSMDEDDPSRQYADGIMHAGMKGAALTKQILAFSRKQALDMKPVNINDIIVNLRKMLRRLVREDIGINLNLADRDLIVMADTGQIEQSLINLTTNARDAMPNGGTITISTSIIDMDEKFVETHGFGRPDKYALISFSDTGCGIYSNLFIQQKNGAGARASDSPRFME
jgi:PAS domain S-box-containing protein